MKARFPGTCSLCHRRYAAGAEIVRLGAGWSCQPCGDRFQASPGAPPPASGSPEEVRQVLAEARAVARRAEAEARSRR